MLDHRFSANPVARAELAYQTRSRPQVQRWKRVTTRVILIAALTLACILAGGEFAGVVLYRDPDPISRVFGILNTLPVATAFILHFVLMIQTLSLSANSVAREKQANNWDILVLTGVDARQIIRGKWWATVRRMWPSYAFLGVLRALVIIWYSTSVSRNFSYYGYYFYNSSGSVGNPPEIVMPLPVHFLLTATVVFTLTMVNLTFTAACGVSAISARTRSSALTLGRAIGTRLLFLIGLSLAIISVTWLIWRGIDPSSYSVWSNYMSVTAFSQGVAGTLIDNGVNAGSQLVTYRSTFFQQGQVYSPLAVALTGLGVYLLLTWLLLRLAQWQATRQNALSPLTPSRPNYIQTRHFPNR